MIELNMLSYAMLICFTILSFGRCEPHCSKFHYEEKLLEKMVRLEFKLEQFERGYKEMKGIIHEERQKLQEDAVKSKEQMEESKTSIASKLDDLEVELKLMSEKMLKDVRDATTAMEASQQQNEAKIARLEFKLEQFERGYKDMEGIIREERQKLQEDAVKSKEQMEESKASIASKLDDLEDELKLMSEKMLKDVRDATTAMEASQQQNGAKMARLSADTRKFQNETITNLTNLVKIPDVFFKAKDLADLTATFNDTFVYKTVLQNEGGGYDAGRGVFTSPVDGDYLFTAQVCVEAKSYIHYAFVIDDVEQKAMVVWSLKQICGTGTLFSRLKKGARVWLKSKRDSIAFQNSYRWNVFSGILLKV